MNTPQTFQQKLEFFSAAPAQLKPLNDSIKEAEGVIHTALANLGEAVKLLDEHLATKEKVLAELSKISSDIIGGYERELEMVKEFKRSKFLDYESRLVIAWRAESSINQEIEKWKSREDVIHKGYDKIIKKRAALRAALREHLDAFTDSISLQ